MKIILLSIYFTVSIFAMGLPAEYYKIQSPKEMKNYFILYILKIAKKENNSILKDRFFIKNVYPNISKIPKNSPVYKRFKAIKLRYKLSDKATFQQHIEAIDIVPNSLVIAQAIVESGWGKSRFVKEANNIFGQWTWSGKGLDPAKRDVGKKHQIKIFPSVIESVKGYMINLNLGWGYKDFRKLRAKIRGDKSKLTGIILSDTLINYSQKREEYIRILKNIITQNKLAKYDNLNF